MKVQQVLWFAPGYCEPSHNIQYAQISTVCVCDMIYKTVCNIVNHACYIHIHTYYISMIQTNAIIHCQQLTADFMLKFTFIYRIALYVYVQVLQQLCVQSHYQVLKSTDAPCLPLMFQGGLGRAVLNRSEATGQMLTRKALELVGMVEGSPAAPKAPNAPEIESKSPVVTPLNQVTPVAPVNSDLMALSRQLQLQQQQFQQQLEELKRIKSEAATPRQVVKAPEVDMEALQAEEQPLQTVSNKSPARKRSKGATMSLAAEAVEASHEGSHVRAAKSLPQTPAPTLQTALPDVSREKSDAKSKAEEDDSTRLQAPKDFPAALRGGWQALLAKKRAEGVKKTPKAEEHSTSIMDLMQTPKTYTAWCGAHLSYRLYVVQQIWLALQNCSCIRFMKSSIWRLHHPRQPDKNAAQPAEKAKEDLLAAEKAFDDDEDSEKSTLGRKCLISMLILLCLNFLLVVQCGWFRYTVNHGICNISTAFFEITS